MRVSVIGGGIIGLSVARGLVKKGVEVQLFEQSTIPNPKGSSCDQHRLIRYPYGNQKGYMRMVREAYLAWNAVWEDIEVMHYAQTGTLVTSQTGEGWARDSLEALEEAEIPLTLLHADQLKTCIPHLRMDHVKLAFILESGGALFADRIVASLKEYVLLNGATLHEKTKVTHLNTRQIQTATGDTFLADYTIVTAGPWVGDLIPSFEAIPSQQTVYYLNVPDEDLPAWQKAPMVLDIDPGSGFYLIPPVAGLGLKVGDHRFTLQGHPDSPNPQPSTPALPIFPYPVEEAKTCFYTVAANEEFIYQEIEGVHVLSGFSGHGFKFGPLVGDRFAEVLTGALDSGEFGEWLRGC